MLFSEFSQLQQGMIPNYKMNRTEQVGGSRWAKQRTYWPDTIKADTKMNIHDRSCS